MPYHDFTEMPVWRLGMEIVKEVYSITDKLPKREDYALSGQTRRAAVSIAGNIAEGFGRGHPGDKVNFYYYSRASAYEVKSHLLAGEQVGYFLDVEIASILNKCNQVIADLNRIVSRLQNTQTEQTN